MFVCLVDLMIPSSIMPNPDNIYKVGKVILPEMETFFPNIISSLQLIFLSSLASKNIEQLYYSNQKSPETKLPTDKPQSHFLWGYA